MSFVVTKQRNFFCCFKKRNCAVPKLHGDKRACNIDRKYKEVQAGNGNRHATVYMPL